MLDYNVDQNRIDIGKVRQLDLDMDSEEDVQLRDFQTPRDIIKDKVLQCSS